LTQSFMQTRCSILPSIADKTKHKKSKKHSCKNNVFTAQFHVADWYNRLLEMWTWSPLSSSFTDAVTTITVREFSDTRRMFS
jgi:hypothetical protein